MLHVEETFLDSDDDHLSSDSESEPDFELSDSEENDGEYEESFISKDGTRWSKSPIRETTVGRKKVSEIIRTKPGVTKHASSRIGK